MPVVQIAAVIPVYAPQAAALTSLIEQLAAQGVPVLVSDDASPVTADAVLRGLPSSVGVIRHRRNAGIARGLNDGVAFARQLGAHWLLTIDQDSSIGPHLVADLLATAERDQRIGVVGVETIDDASGTVGFPVVEQAGLLTTQEVFQTGSLWSLEALGEIGGFDERLGIDAVDAAACLRLREHDRLVVLAPGTSIGHHYGTGRQVHLLGRQVVSTGHSPARRESMVRNRLALAPAEFRQSPRHAFRTLRRVAVNTVLGSTIESDRWANAKGSIRGLLPRRTQ